MLTQQVAPRSASMTGLPNTNESMHYLPYVFSPPLTPGNSRHGHPHGHMMRHCVNVALPYGTCLPPGVSALHKQPRKRRSIKELSRGYYCQEHGCPKRYEEWRSLQAHCWSKHAQRVRKNEKKWNMINPTADYSAEEEGCETPEATPHSSLSDLNDFGGFGANSVRDFSPRSAPGSVSATNSFGYSPTNTHTTQRTASSPLVNWDSSAADLCFSPTNVKDETSLLVGVNSMTLGALDAREGSALEVDFSQLDSLFMQIQRVLSEAR